jgi:hypothetical protein
MGGPKLVVSVPRLLSVDGGAADAFWINAKNTSATKQRRFHMAFSSLERPNLLLAGN